jgi:Trp operon repressor
LRRVRTGGGFSSGSLTESRSMRETDESPDEVDEAIDPAEINRRIRERNALPSPQLNAPEPVRRTVQGRPIEEHTEGDAATDGERDDPRMRLNQVAMAGSASYAKEYRMGLLHRLLMRNVPLDQIAQQLQVSISTVEKDRAELKRRLREAAKELNIDEMIGNQTAIYEEMSGMSLRIASSNSTPTAMKLAAIRTALAANADKSRFHNVAGVFDVLRFRRGEDSSDVSDVQRLLEQTGQLLEELQQPEAPRRARVVRRRRGMDFDDPDASGGGREEVDL